MVRHFFPILFIGALTVFPRIYTLEELIDLAESNAVELRRAKKEIDKTEIEIQKDYSAMFPSLNLFVQGSHSFTDASLPYLFAPAAQGWGSYVHRTSAPASVVARSALPVIPFGTVPNRWNNSASGALVVRQEIGTPLKTVNDLRMLRSMQAMAVCRYESVKRTTITGAIKGYYTLLLAQHQLTYSNELERLAQERHRLIKADFTQMAAQVIDTMESALALQECILAKNYSEVKRKNAAEELALNCRIPESAATLWVDGSFPEPVFFISVEEALVMLRENNTTIRQFKGEENVLSRRVTAQKLTFLPDLFVGAALYRMYLFDGIQLPSYSAGIDDRSVFAGLQWNLFSAIGTGHSVALAKNNLDQRLLAQQKIADELEVEVRKKFEEITLQKQSLEVASLSVDIAERRVAAAQISFVSGNGRHFDVLVKQVDLKGKEIKYLELLCSFHRELAGFRELIGSQ